MKKYSYKKVNVRSDLANRAENIMPKIGCPKLSVFVSMALAEFINEQEKKFAEN